LENLNNRLKDIEVFVTVKHILEILNAINIICPFAIAKYEDKVIDYLLH